MYTYYVKIQVSCLQTSWRHDTFFIGINTSCFWVSNSNHDPCTLLTLQKLSQFNSNHNAPKAPKYTYVLWMSCSICFTFCQHHSYVHLTH